MKHKFLILISLLLFFQPLHSQERANVLLVTIDTLRWDRLSVYSKKYVQTPVIDGVAKKGAVFHRAFAHTPLTLPSHANILTGTTSLYHGIYSNVSFELNDGFVTLAEVLKDAQYTTAAFVASTVLGRHTGLRQGFDVYDEPIVNNERIAGTIIPRALRWIESQNGKWFCWLHLWDPHSPYDPPAPFAARFEKDRYSGEVAYLDRELAALFQMLEQVKYKNRTIVIITGDHGEGLGDHGELEHGYFTYNSTIHIPLIMTGPDIPRNQYRQPVGHIDIFPTVCDLVRIKKPGHLKGKSLTLLFQGKPFKEEAIYFESKEPYYVYGWAPLEGFISKNRKYISLPIPELYDLTHDFDETKNIISSVRINDLRRPLNRLINFHKGKETSLAQKKMSDEQLRRLRSLGYISGFQQDAGKAYSRDKDLKVLLPIQNLFKRAGLHANKKEYEQAVGLYRQIAEEMPSFLGAYYYLADLYEKQGRPELAKQILAKGLKQVESDKNTTLKLKYAILLAQTGEEDQAITLFYDILATDKRNAQAWNYLGISQMRKGQSDNALKSFTKAVEIDPKYSLAYFNLGIYYLMDFQKSKRKIAYDHAVRNFSAAIKFNPNSAIAYNNRAITRRINNEVQSAVEDWQRALKIKPGFVDVYFYLAGAYIEMKEKESALKVLNKCKETLYQKLSVRQQNRLNALLIKASSL